MRHGLSWAARSALLILTVCVGAPSGAEDLALQPRYQAGDVYSLSLHTRSHTVQSRGNERALDDAELRYRATVIVLETDADGRPVRERHHGVKLDFARPETSGSLLADGASFELRRDRDGGVRLFAADGRLDRDVEKTIERALAAQLGFSAVPALLQPDRAVAVGESWTIDPRRVRHLLRDRGMRAVDLDGDATATLEQVGAGDERVLAVRYRIPVSRWEPRKLHPNQRTAASQATVEGEVRLAADGSLRPVGHTARLVRRVQGVKAAWGVAAPVAWSLETAESSEESTRLVQRGLAANL